MITPAYAVTCLKLGFERYIRYSKIPARMKCSNTTISFYVDKKDTESGKPANARVSNHHPNMENYTKGGNSPWENDNVSIEFIVPKSADDVPARARVRQNSRGTIIPFGVGIYQYDPSVLDGKDLSEIFKAVAVFLNGNGYSDPFSGTQKEAIFRPMSAHIKPLKRSGDVTECTYRYDSRQLTEEYLERVARMCMKEAYDYPCGVYALMVPRAVKDAVHLVLAESFGAKADKLGRWDVVDGYRMPGIHRGLEEWGILWNTRMYADVENRTAVFAFRLSREDTRMLFARRDVGSDRYVPIPADEVPPEIVRDSRRRKDEAF